MPNVLRVQRAGFFRVVRALDDRSAIREHRELVIVAGFFQLELQQKTVKAHLARNAQLLREIFKVQLAGNAVRNLHGIASAQARSLSAVLAFEPLELVLLATGTISLL